MTTPEFSMYEPTAEDREAARQILDASPDADPHFVIGATRTCLDHIAEGAPPDREIRIARALYAEYRKRRYES